MRPSDVLRQKRPLIREVVAQYRLKNPRVFGSVAEGTDREGSDLDLLVDPSETTTLFDLGGLQDALETELGIPVDVVTPKELHPRFRDQVIAGARSV